MLCRSTSDKQPGRVSGGNPPRFIANQELSLYFKAHACLRFANANLHCAPRRDSRWPGHLSHQSGNDRPEVGRLDRGGLSPIRPPVFSFGGEVLVGSGRFEFPTLCSRSKRPPAYWLDGARVQSPCTRVWLTGFAPPLRRLVQTGDRGQAASLPITSFNPRRPA